MAHCLDGHFGVGIGSIAAREEALFAEPAFATTDRERDYHAVAFPQIGNFRTHFNDFAHILVAENVALLHRRLIPIKQVQIGTAYSAGGDLDYSVARVLNFGIWNIIHPHITFAVPT